MLQLTNKFSYLLLLLLLLFVQLYLNSLVSEAQPGDSLLFFFSGHGGQVPSDEEEADGMDECIFSTEMGQLTDDDLRAILENLPEGVKFTMISGECCAQVQVPTTIETTKGGNCGSLHGCQTALNLPACFNSCRQVLFIAFRY
jgi:hypothetical protein